MGASSPPAARVGVLRIVDLARGWELQKGRGLEDSRHVYLEPHLRKIAVWNQASHNPILTGYEPGLRNQKLSHLKARYKNCLIH